MIIKMTIRLDLSNPEPGKTSAETAKGYIENSLNVIERQVQYWENSIAAPCVDMKDKNGKRIGNVTTNLLAR